MVCTTLALLVFLPTQLAICCFSVKKYLVSVSTLIAVILPEQLPSFDHLDIASRILCFRLKQLSFSIADTVACFCFVWSSLILSRFSANTTCSAFLAFCAYFRCDVTVWSRLIASCNSHCPILAFAELHPPSTCDINLICDCYLLNRGRDTSSHVTSAITPTDPHQPGSAWMTGWQRFQTLERPLKWLPAPHIAGRPTCSLQVVRNRKQPGPKPRCFCYCCCFSFLLYVGSSFCLSWERCRKSFLSLQEFYQSLLVQRGSFPGGERFKWNGSLPKVIVRDKK